MSYEGTSLWDNIKQGHVLVSCGRELETIFDQAVSVRLSAMLGMMLVRQDPALYLGSGF